jgi:very-short-patch-repair endonuclease
MKNSVKNKAPLSSGVVLLQRVDDKKIQQARDLRKKMTPAEYILWQRLRSGRNHGLKFRRQQIIEGFIVDFFCHESKLVVEIDGGIHETRDQAKIDEHRRKVFAARGLREIRFANEEIFKDLDSVLDRIHTEAECQ